MITEDYVSFKTAKLLKEKGFMDGAIVKFFASGYDENGNILDIRDTELKDYPRPTLQMAMKWLREVHKCFIKIKEYFDIKEYQAFVSKCGKTTYCEPDWFHPICNSYEEACEAAIKYCLENLI